MHMHSCVFDLVICHRNLVIAFRSRRHMNKNTVSTVDLSTCIYDGGNQISRSTCMNASGFLYTLCRYVDTYVGG
jgi:hypothetical protein